MSLIESVLFVANGYIGYKVLGAVDVGEWKAILSRYGIKSNLLHLIRWNDFHSHFWCLFWSCSGSRPERQEV